MTTRKTTCHNTDCPKFQDCEFSIWTADRNTITPCGTKENRWGNYLSAKDAIYRHYQLKEQSEGRKPASRTEYFEEW